MAGYIVRIREQRQTEIEPSLAARELRTTEAHVTGLLMLLEEEEMVRHVYNIYCAKNRAFLASARERNEIPRVLYCKFCEKEHNRPDDFEIELAFQIIDAAWERLAPNVVAR